MNVIAWRIFATAAGHIRRRPGLALAALLTAVASTGAFTYLVGDAVGRSNDLLDEMRSPSARSILIRSTRSSAIDDVLPADATRALASLPGVETAVGLTPVRSATNAMIPGNDTTVGYFTITVLAGDDPFVLTAGRTPRHGEALVTAPAAERLRMDVPQTSTLNVDGEHVPIVGGFATIGLGRISELLATSALTLAPPTDEGYGLIVLTVARPADLRVVVDRLPVLFSDRTPTDYTAEYDDRLVDVEATVARSGRRSVRSTAIAIAIVGAGVQAVATAVNALTQRREIARRRALGATRSMVLGAIVTETVVLTGVGAVVGATAAVAYLSRKGMDVDPGIAPNAAVFVVLASALAAVPGGLFGALQDPAKILRVP